MIQQGFEFSYLKWIFWNDSEMDARRWQLVQECTSLEPRFDPMFDPTNPSVLSLPKLKTLCAHQEDAANVVREYKLPALEELVRPSVSLLRRLPNKGAIKHMKFDRPTDEIIKSVADYT